MNLTQAQLEQLYCDQQLHHVLSQTAHVNRLWQIAVPKSGSTWLTKILRHLYVNQGWTVGTLLPACGTRYQEIDPRYLLFEALNTGRVFYGQQHCVYSEYTKRLIDVTQMRCILQVRNLFDVAVSIRDQYRGIIAHGGTEAEIIPAGMCGATDQALLDYVIAIDMPWIIKLVAGWLHSPLINDEKMLQVTYEQLLQDVGGTVGNIMAFAGLDVAASAIDEAIARASADNTRKNKGVSGRGKEALSQEQVERILYMADCLGIKGSELLSLS